MNDSIEVFQKREKNKLLGRTSCRPEETSVSHQQVKRTLEYIQYLCSIVPKYPQNRNKKRTKL